MILPHKRRMAWLGLLGTAALLLAADGVAARAAAPAEMDDAQLQAAAVASTAEPDKAEASRQPAYVTESLRGRIVWLAEALQRRYGIRSAPQAAERVLALEEANGGSLHPLVEDERGGSFRKDPRLRALADCELLVRRYEGSPMVQVIRIFSYEDGQKLELDYWCEVCAITMFELKPCDCCQGEIELRKRPVTD